MVTVSVDVSCNSRYGVNIQITLPFTCKSGAAYTVYSALGSVYNSHPRSSTEMSEVLHNTNYFKPQGYNVSSTATYSSYYQLSSVAGRENHFRTTITYRVA
jgi:hypothetical protein